MNEWKIKTIDGPDGELIINKETPRVHGFNARLAINFSGEDEYLAIYLTTEEAKEIAKALLASVE